MSRPTRAAERRRKARIASHTNEVTRPGFLIKLVPMMPIDALEIYSMFTAYLVRSWTIFAVLVVLLFVVNQVYFSKWTIPTKHLVPGVIFLPIYQVFITGYTGYMPFTNHGQDRNSSEADTVASILQASEQRAEDTSSLPATVIEDSDSLGLAVVDIVTDTIRADDSETSLHEVFGTYAAGAISAISGYKVLTIAEIPQPETWQKVSAVKVPVSGDPSSRNYRSDDRSTAYLVKFRYNYSGAADTSASTTTGVIYTVNDKVGTFTDANDNQVNPGWRVFIDFDNYMNTFARNGLVGPLLKALLRSFVFAAASILSTFAFGLVLGLVLADKRIKGHKVYQSLAVLPHAFPTFLVILVWKDMLNKDSSFINEALPGGTNISWLTDGVLAEFSILDVSLWLDFPYMFLMCLGALQSLSGDVEEAVKTDGTFGLHTIWFIKLPLVLQPTAPLLTAPFAFNSNDFPLTYVLINDDPNYLGPDIGQTSILTSMVYKIAIGSDSPNCNLASTVSVVILIIVGAITWLGSRQTKTLEEL